MVKKWLPTRFSAGQRDDLSTADTASVRSGVSQWTTASTVQGENDRMSFDEDLSLAIHPLSTQDGLIAKITPPTGPSKPIAHVPCDIVLVIDVSGSMGSNAPIPANPGEQAENYGLSVLDLVKHAAKTILETLNEGDRLGIVTFASSAKVLQKLTPMDSRNKKIAAANIDGMRPLDMTNLWHGLLESIKLFKEAGEANMGRVPAIFLLTDGMPNHMCPPQGYVPKIRSMEQLPASIHTFGFGYSLRSGLLKSIAEIGGGNYAFIPDAGMIGTVFVHALANLQATYATDTVLRLTYPATVELEETTGDSVDKQKTITLPDEDGEPRQLTILLGNIQYGQSRDIYLRVKPVGGGSLENVNIQASLEYSRMTSVPDIKRVTQSLATSGTLSEAEIAYHVSRSQICEFLSSIFPIRSDGEHVGADRTGPIGVALEKLIADLPAQNFPNDTKNQALLEDLTGAEPKGQISIALGNPEFYKKWGIHYLPSLLNAHTRQICNTFKDSGPLQYGVDSPLFIACRDKLDNAFDNLPPPKPSNYATASHRGNFSMSKYHQARGVCFVASTPVRLASGLMVPISSLRKGTTVATLSGSRKVFAILKTQVRNETMCRVGSLVVTPWHPISLNGGKTWAFPAESNPSMVRYTGYIYSVLLQANENTDAHSIQLVDDITGVTLGHGLVSGTDVRSHAFFGNYLTVLRSLKAVGMDRKTGIASGSGVKRSRSTGLVTGFRKGRSAVLVTKRPAITVKLHRSRVMNGRNRRVAAQV